MLLIMSCILMTGIMFQSCKESDSKIQENVQKELTNKYNNFSISSSVRDGAVTLNGMVESQAQKTAVENDVAKVSGVKRVMNNIAIRETNVAPQQPATSSDNTMRTAVESRLKSEGFNDVRVDVTNGEIVLSGSLKRSDLTKVMQIANESSPRKVTNNITLK
ncbi:MAG: BON domain-containing protein [Bacteroides sp.]|nr:BON domain-containing protein [Bacteroides sp.]